MVSTVRAWQTGEKNPMQHEFADKTSWEFKENQVLRGTSTANKNVQTQEKMSNERFEKVFNNVCI